MVHDHNGNLTRNGNLIFEYVDQLVRFERTAAHPLGAGGFYMHQNERWDVIGVTDASGNVVEKRRYDDYGVMELRDPTGTAVLSTSPSGLGYGFQGREHDAETGLSCFRARYYDPEHGRFISRDPVYDPGNHGNSYGFVGNAPSSGLDPWGLNVINAIGNACQVWPRLPLNPPVAMFPGPPKGAATPAAAATATRIAVGDNRQPPDGINPGLYYRIEIANLLPAKALLQRFPTE
jgi:RHS repeat-associated protein